MTDQNDDQTRTHIVLKQGTIVSHYRILDKIGAGGMGEVYLAEDSKLKRNVALKFLSINQQCDDAVLKQFLLEAQAVARLQHPNIITVHEVSKHEGRPYIAMAFVEGQALDKYSSNMLLPLSEIIDLGLQIANGLTAAHEKGVTHRDLKPGNIMIDKSGSAMILDFGLAILSNIETDKDPDATRTSTPLANKIAGTILYMAPEQLLGTELDSRVDIFALGVILHELITHKHPFAAPSVQEISASILRDTPADLSLKRADIPYDLKRIVNRCLAKKPDRRFQTARDVGNELEELANDLKLDRAVIVSDNGQSKQGPDLSEESFGLTTDLIRKLSNKDPKMIGTKLAYLDNKVSSDEIIFYLHGIGADQRQFSDVLRQLPFRAISLSLYGFDENAQLRLPLELHDHSILLHALIKDVCHRLKPKKIVMIGFSSGADHLLHCLTSELFDDIKVQGLLSLGCNIHLKDCFASGKFAELTSDDEAQILSIIELFSRGASSISDWLVFHSYLVTAFSKFGKQTEPFRKFAADILEPFKEGDWEQFPKWYKSCVKKLPHVRFITDSGGCPALDGLMREHLENNVLGDDFHESSIVRVSDSHMDLVKTEVMLRLTFEFMKQLEAK